MELFKKIHLEKRYSWNFQSCNSALVGFWVILCVFFTKYAVTASLFLSIIKILNILCIKHIYVAKEVDNCRFLSYLRENLFCSFGFWKKKTKRQKDKITKNTTTMQYAYI